ncbi:Methylthioribose-1-phosphate isomerase [Polystyrenella longa]|uniref:Methylthioribose-1-phosphate isomerase n=1 Tax=Polystyrenella longa TaxID=2528007 RepID=A0A518CQD1_9PLAN|nr:S-methyl-5-thioribose-1-phosphate isomerase [Polystyrenella longa]QDU81423.1 Methylthioribose-1-phosphate isomerase [Polystyrenella longa]
MASLIHKDLSTLRWDGELPGTLNMIDQTLLPEQFLRIDCNTPEETWQAIKRLSVRGAPAIGVAAAYGLILGVQHNAHLSQNEFLEKLNITADYLAESRPTAVNLFWALDRMRQTAATHADLETPQLLERLLAEARAIEQEDQAMCIAMGEFGQTLLKEGQGVLTHCNAGALATSGSGTALSVFYAAARAGKKIHVYADETRPLLQGARLTSWELQNNDIEVTLICDSMAGWVMKEKRVQAVITGADRVAANGDAANKIGTYSVSLLAKAHGIPFYIVAPSSTFDFALATGDSIPIEQRDPTEISHGCGKQTAPAGVHIYNPAFDVTPAENITAIVTEKGIISPVTTENIAAMLKG